MMSFFSICIGYIPLAIQALKLLLLFDIYLTLPTHFWFLIRVRCRNPPTPIYTQLDPFSIYVDTYTYTHGTLIGPAMLAITSIDCETLQSDWKIPQKRERLKILEKKRWRNLDYIENRGDGNKSQVSREKNRLIWARFSNNKSLSLSR